MKRKEQVNTIRKILISNYESEINEFVGNFRFDYEEFIRYTCETTADILNKIETKRGNLGPDELANITLIVFKDLMLIYHDKMYRLL
ncbi:hypothetical protein [Lysinibacillus sp. SGAir0095]|uniref:hypothetical protein n=1 Tax=Lysinibacillus sp. SGAir0095 TaxID=2070463 RepID=UPI0010CD14BB|nr:hypothetical protein [Lysinibacillus sp. SGAir0095]QCR33106.1 hypothetical protein C1N55_13360 [Lysinibacillus sp. SGAir0095]